MSTLQSEIDALAPWFHNLHLPDGTRTLPTHPLIWGDFPAYKWAFVADAIPADLTGWRVLDIGCNAGFYTFELAKRGATVLGIDVDERYPRPSPLGGHPDGPGKTDRVPPHAGLRPRRS